MTSNGYGDGSYSPYRTVSEATPCSCGHRADDHDGLTGPCQWAPNVYRDGGEWDSNPCECRRLEPDEDR